MTKIRIPRPKRFLQRNSGPSKSGPLKIRIEGKDQAPLSIADLRDGLYQALRELGYYESEYRAKWVTLYLTVVDENGVPVQVNRNNEWTIYPFKPSAEEYDC